MGIKDNFKNDDGSINYLKTLGGCCGLIIILGILLVAIASLSNISHNSTTTTYNDSYTPGYNKTADLLSNATEVDFDTLKSWKNDNKGSKVILHGKIMQNQDSLALIESEGYDIVYCYGNFSAYGEDEYVTVYGFYNGLYTYTTAIGGSKKVPSLSGCIVKD